MVNICIWGTSCKKVGDEAQMLSVCQILKSTNSKLRLTIFARHGEIIQSQHPEVETMPTAQLFKTLGKLVKSDLFVIVGGPFMESTSQIISCSLLVMAAKIFRVPVISFGTTVLPYMTPWGKFCYQKVFNGIQEITVREKVSYEILEKLNIRTPISLYGDPRYVLQPSNPDETSDILRQNEINIDKPIVGITLRHMHSQIPEWVKRSHGYTDDHVENAYDIIGQTVDRLSEYAQVVVLPMHPNHEDDVKATQKIQKHMKNPANLKVLSRSLRAPELMGIIRECEMLIACRLASAIFSTATGTPTVGIAYEPRLIDHMSQIGFEGCVTDWRELDGQFIKKAIDTWSSRETMGKKMEAISFESIASAWKYADFVENFMKMHGKPDNPKKCQPLEHPSCN